MLAYLTTLDLDALARLYPNEAALLRLASASLGSQGGMRLEAEPLEEQGASHFGDFEPSAYP